MVLGWYSKEDEMRNGNGKGSGKLNGGFLYVWKSEGVVFVCLCGTAKKVYFLVFRDRKFFTWQGVRGRAQRGLFFRTGADRGVERSAGAVRGRCGVVEPVWCAWSRCRQRDPRSEIRSGLAGKED